MSPQQRKLLTTFLPLGVVLSMPSLLYKYLGMAPFVSLAIMGFLYALWAAFNQVKTNRRLADENTALNAKYEEKMQNLLQEAKTNQPTPH